MTEKEYIDHLKKRDTKVFELFVKTFQDQVIRTCYGLTHNIDDAKDIAQEVFIEIYNSINKFRQKSSVKTWMYRIAVNKSLNFLRDNKKRKQMYRIDSVLQLSKLENKISNVPTDVFIENEYQQELKKVIFKSIDKLPKNQRIAFVLNKYEEMSYKQIADVMKISYSSVESLIHRAKEKLKKDLIVLKDKIYRKDL